jgi:hypothetical protein
MFFPNIKKMASKRIRIKFNKKKKLKKNEIVKKRNTQFKNLS